MKNSIKILGLALAAVVLVAALGVGAAFAQNQTPNTGYGPGWMMGGNAQTGGGWTGGGRMGGRGMMGGNAQTGDTWAWMDAMHQWMNASGGMHTFVWDALTAKLGLTSDELTAELNSGKTIAQVAEEKGVSRADLIATLETAHKDSLAQAVTDGVLTQEQADNILTQMAGRYEWMLDNAGFGQAAGGRGGMMNGQGGCQGWNTTTTTTEQPKP